MLYSQSKLIPALWLGCANLLLGKQDVTAHCDDTGDYGRGKTHDLPKGSYLRTSNLEEVRGLLSV